MFIPQIGSIALSSRLLTAYQPLAKLCFMEISLLRDSNSFNGCLLASFLQELDIDSSFPGRKTKPAAGGSSSTSNDEPSSSASSLRTFRVVSNQQNANHHIPSSSLERPPASQEGHRQPDNDASTAAAAKSSLSIELSPTPLTSKGEEEKSPKGAPPAAKTVTWN